MKNARLIVRTLINLGLLLGVPLIASASCGTTSCGNIMQILGWQGTGGGNTFDFNNVVGFVTGPLSLWAAAHGAHMAFERAKQAQFQLNEMLHSGVGAAFGFILVGGIGTAWTYWHGTQNGTALNLAYHGGHLAIHVLNATTIVANTLH